jgi:hypothetical protein
VPPKNPSLPSMNYVKIANLRDYIIALT